MSTESLRLVQLFHPSHGRRVAIVQEPLLALLDNVATIYELSFQAIKEGKKLKETIGLHLSTETLDYSTIYTGNSHWKLLPSFDHPDGPMGCVVSGTGLTHKNSALNWQMMHQAENEKPTDSLQMYQWGVDGGFPEHGTVGIQPEWFYKGNGSTLRAHGEPLEIPYFGNDGGEEPEVAGIYVIDASGNPWRIGFSTANEFSDHVMEKKNYLYLAPSKLRNCSIGPELVIDEDFTELNGTVKITRSNEEVWSATIKTGQSNMAHSLENLEHHHFKYPCHRVPFQGHVHFFGADAFSFGKVQLQDNDAMEIYWEGMGRSLQNPLKISSAIDTITTIQSLK